MSTFRNYNLELDDKIEALKLKRKNDFDALNMQFNKSYQELRPAKIAKRVFNDLASEPEIKTNLIQTVLSIAGGYLSKKLIIGKSNGLFKSILGYGVQYLSTKLISKKINSEA